MLKDMLIDYDLLARAVLYYNACGYQQIESPWMVDRKTIDLTLPPDATPFLLTNGDAMVGSAEQGLINMTLREELTLNKKYMSISPCFRDDKNDDTHSKTFMKLELFCFTPSSNFDFPDGRRMIFDAKTYFEMNGIKCEYEETPLGLDIVTKKNKLELGSYGYRTIHHYDIYYGTGLALPRFSLAREQEYGIS